MTPYLPLSERGEPICPYCDSVGVKVPDYLVYGPRSHGRSLWACLNCRERGSNEDDTELAVYVGCHRGSDRPLGSMADRELRDLRQQVHRLFDPLWEGKRSRMSRTEAYHWLAHQMQISINDCHIAYFRFADCHKAIKILRDHITETKYRDKGNGRYGTNSRFRRKRR